MFTVLGADQKEYGPVSAEQLRQWIAERRLVAQSLVRPAAAGDTGWQPLAAYPEFADALAATRPTALPPAGAVPGARASATNGLAVAGFIVSLVSITFGLLCCGFLFSAAGLALCTVGLVQIHQNPQTQSGKGLAIAGLVLSGLSLLISIALPLVLGQGVFFKELLRHIGK